METRRLGNSGIVVSQNSLGTLTLRTPPGKARTFRIMERALDAGNDIFDTAELYPVPPN